MSGCVPKRRAQFFDEIADAVERMEEARTPSEACACRGVARASAARPSFVRIYRWIPGQELLELGARSDPEHAAPPAARRIATATPVTRAALVKAATASAPDATTVVLATGAEASTLWLARRSLRRAAPVALLVVGIDDGPARRRTSGSSSS